MNTYDIIVTTTFTETKRIIARDAEEARAKAEDGGASLMDDPDTTVGEAVLVTEERLQEEETERYLFFSLKGRKPNIATCQLCEQQGRSHDLRLDRREWSDGARFALLYFICQNDGNEVREVWDAVTLRFVTWQTPNDNGHYED